MTETQTHILRHFRDNTCDPDVEIDKQLSLFNESCLVGMVETGEATIDDMLAVGGPGLAGRIAKKVQRDCS